MEHHVLKVDREVHRDHGQNEACPVGEPARREKSEALLARHQCGAECRRGEEKPQYQDIQRNQPQVVRPSRRLRQAQLSSGSEELREGHDGEDAQEKGESDLDLVEPYEFIEGAHLCRP